MGNTEDNLARSEAAGEPWHPCLHYLRDDSKMNLPDFQTDFDIGRLLTFDTLVAAAKTAKSVAGNMKATRRSKEKKGAEGDDAKVQGGGEDGDEKTKKSAEGDEATAKGGGENGGDGGGDDPERSDKKTGAEGDDA